MNPIRVLIADDHRIVREGLKQMLADAPDIEVRAEATTGAEVLSAVQTVNGTDGLGVVLLDIAMPDGVTDGLFVCRLSVLKELLG